MGGELVLLAAALAFPLAGSHLSMVAAAVAVAETLRSLVKYLRAPSRPEPAAAPPFSGPTSSVPERR
jgi:hypothetical protein